MLQEAGLERFAKEAHRLMEYWLEDGQADALIRNMEAYVIAGGAYGSVEKSLVIKRERAGGKVAYYWRRIFVPYDTIAVRYPIVKKCNWLVPFFQVHRWFVAIHDCDRFIREARFVADSENDYSVTMMQELGL